MVMITIQNASCFTDGDTIPHISGEIEVEIDNFKTGDIIYLVHRFQINRIILESLQKGSCPSYMTT